MLSRTKSTLAIAALAVFAALLTPAATAAPSAGARDEQLEARGDIVINSDAEFTVDKGVRSGLGTPSHPYVISGWRVQNLVIRNTSKYLVVKNNRVDGTMILDWTSRGLAMTNNTVNDLRVNQNVERTGAATTGIIARNVFTTVGQLRHFDGVFEKNVIGSEELLAKKPARKAVQFDGFHGARFRRNTIYGYVDVKLHGHHHGSGFKDHSHDHGPTSESPVHAGHGPNRHTKRYHEVFITDNEIHSSHAWALRYYDRGHTGDDRTNASETNLLLNCPHEHFTRVHVIGNVLDGAGLVVDVFNAADENHWRTNRGLVEIRHNRITLDRDTTELLGGRHGILVQEAVDVNVDIARNVVVGPDLLGENDVLSLEKKLYRGAGIRLHHIDKAKIRILSNEVRGRQYGVHASQMTKKVIWTIRRLTTAKVEEEVHTEDSVARRPRN